MKDNKGNLKALLPIAVFLVLYIGGGIALGSFYALPTVFVFLVALMVAFLQNKELSFDKKIHVIAQGLADDNIITMCLIFLLGLVTLVRETRVPQRKGVLLQCFFRN